MATTALVLGSIAGYFLIGCLVARALSLRFYAAARRAWRGNEMVRESYHTRLGLAIALWPGIAPWALWKAITKLALRIAGAPVEQRQAKIAQLQRDLAHWDNLRNIGVGTPEDRRIAEQLIPVLRDRIRDLQL